LVKSIKKWAIENTDRIRVVFVSSRLPECQLGKLAAENPRKKIYSWEEPSCELIYQANGPVPLTQLKEMPYGTLFFVDELQTTVDFAGPRYRKVYEVIMQMLTATENSD
jgi:hypothetical protein